MPNRRYARGLGESEDDIEHAGDYMQMLMAVNVGEFDSRGKCPLELRLDFRADHIDSKPPGYIPPNERRVGLGEIAVRVGQTWQIARRRDAPLAHQ